MRPVDTKGVVLANLFVAICTTSLTLQSVLLLNIKIDSKVLTLVFVSTFFIYTFHRWIKMRKIRAEEITMNEINMLINLRALSIIAGIILIPLIASLGPNRLELFVLTGAITLWYSFGFLRLKNHFFTLRRIPFAKVFLIAAVWTVMTVFLPAGEETYSTEFFTHALERFFFVFALTIPFDIRDSEVDEKDGILTFPNRFGKKWSLYLSVAVLVLFVFAGLVLYFQSERALLTEIAMVLSALITGYFVLKSVNKNSNAFYSYTLEGMSLLQSALIIFVLHI